MPLPAAPAEDAAASPEKAAAGQPRGAGAEKAANEPVLNQVDGEQGGGKTSGGDAAKVDPVRLNRRW